MKMNADNIRLLIREGEGLTTEFKQKYSSRVDEDIVAFANTKGGRLLLGVRDDGSIAGESLTGELKGRINALVRNCKPGIHIEVAQAGDIVIVEVPEGTEKPYSCGSGYFRRFNGTTQKMNHDEIKIMFRDHDTVSFEEKIIKRFTLADVSREKIRAFTHEAEIGIGKTGTIDFLRSLNVADGSKINNAGILFFAKTVRKHLPQAKTTLLAFKGTEKIHIFDRQDVQDDLLTQFNESIRFIKRHINVRSEIKGVDREDIYEIPLEALREAVVNAIMHRDYSITGTQINVEIYDDRIEIINPGGLFGGMPKKALGTMSIRRNELVSDLFSRIHKVERVGMGIKRIRKALREAGLKEPEFETNGFFKIVIHRSPEFAMRDAGRQPESRPESSTSPVPVQYQSLEERILALLRDSALPVSTLSKQLGQQRVSGQLKVVLKKLLSEALIEFTIPDKPNSRLQKYRLTSIGKKALKAGGRRQ